MREILAGNACPKDVIIALQKPAKSGYSDACGGTRGDIDDGARDDICDD